jgi:hypothetical protein
MSAFGADRSSGILMIWGCDCDESKVKENRMPSTAPW